MKRMASTLIVLVVLSLHGTVSAASLEATTSRAWEEYLESVKMRMEQRLSLGKTFLWVDEAAERLAKVRAGETLVSPVGPQNPKRVPAGLIHDWLGATFIAHATLNDVLEVVRDYTRYKEVYGPAVVDSRVIATDETKDQYSTQVFNKSLFLKTVLNIDYECSYVHLDDRRMYDIARSTRIQEIEDFGGPGQRVLDEGDSRGIIWRAFSTTRYLERDGGVYLELEAIALSRDIPASLRWLVEPMVRRISRASLSTSLRQTEEAVRSRVELANRKTGTAGATAATTRGGTATQNSHAASSFR
jgi:hypothetical protein